MIDLSLIWVGIIGLGVLIYVVMDGFDLGIGIMFPFIKNSQERDVMMNTVAPVWDGNETWMVLGVLACMQPSRWSILRFYLRSTCLLFSWSLP